MRNSYHAMGRCCGSVHIYLLFVFGIAAGIPFWCYHSGVTMEKSQPYFPPSCRMKFNNPSDAYLNECVLKRESTVIIVLGQTGRPIKCSTVNSKTKKPFKSHIPILHFLNTPCKCVLCKVGHGVRPWRQLQKHMNRFNMEIIQKLLCVCLLSP